MSVRVSPRHVPCLVPVDDEPGIDLAALVAVLCDLGRVDWLGRLGENGPLVASAGVTSLFHCLFGRDAIQMAFDLLEDFPAVAQTTILELARLQGVRRNPRADEEPGRILHEHRQVNDPHLLKLSHHWDFPYYGTVDSTPRWIALLAAYCAAHGDALLDETVVNRRGRRVTLRASLTAAVRWLVGRLDDGVGDGFLWVRRSDPHGIANQVWEDSFDSYYHEDGALFDAAYPYAPVAVQGYAYDALLGAAELIERHDARTRMAGIQGAEGYGSSGADATDQATEGRGARSRPGRARGGRRELRPAALRARADTLRAQTIERFWQPDLGAFALALTFGPGEGGRPARLVSSSAGHLLASRLLDGDQVAEIRQRLIARLQEPDMLAGAGVRTRALGVARFRAGSYHNGSTWPMDSGIIADGFRRHGEEAAADDLETRILTGCAIAGGFPEFFRGEEDGSIGVNVTTIDSLENGVLNRLEQPPQPNQGWTATRVWRILRRRGFAPDA